MFMMSEAVPAEELATVTARDMAPMAAVWKVGRHCSGLSQQNGRPKRSCKAGAQPAGGRQRKAASGAGGRAEKQAALVKISVSPAAKVETTKRKVATTAELDCRPICK